MASTTVKTNAGFTLRTQSNRRFVLIAVHLGGEHHGRQTVIKRSDSRHTIRKAFLAERYGRRFVVDTSTKGLIADSGAPGGEGYNYL